MTRQAVFTVYFNNPKMNIKDIFGSEFSLTYAELKTGVNDKALSMYAYPLSNLSEDSFPPNRDQLLLNDLRKTKIEFIDLYAQLRNWLQDYSFYLAHQIKKEQKRLKDVKSIKSKSMMPGLLFLRAGPLVAKRNKRKFGGNLWENFFLNALNKSLRKN
jgi:hypothetical protein